MGLHSLSGRTPCQEGKKIGRKYFKTSKIVQLRYAEKDSEELRDLLRERDVIMAALTSGAN